jgi:uncharacterized protein
MLNIQCPTCKKQTEFSSNNTFRPFCCERCKLIDLGEWAAEKHAIPGNEVSEMDESSANQERFF